jgi:hypothetical protein
MALRGLIGSGISYYGSLDIGVQYHLADAACNNTYRDYNQGVASSNTKTSNANEILDIAPANHVNGSSPFGNLQRCLFPDSAVSS